MTAPLVSSVLILCLYDVRGKRFYPSYATWRPWPGTDVQQPAQRWQSRGNHNTGFETLADAQACMRGLGPQLGNPPESNVWLDRFLPFDSKADSDPRYLLLVSDTGEVVNYRFYGADELQHLQPVDDESLTLTDPDRT